MSETEQPVRIGMIVPSSNTTMETEVPVLIRAMAEQVGRQVTFHSARVRMRHVSREELMRMNGSAERAMEELCDAPLDAVGYACLVAIMAMGIGHHRVTEAALSAAGNGVPLVTSAGALVDELKQMGARRIAMVMPYADSLARQVVDYLEAEGIDVADYRNLRVTDNLEVGRIAGQRVLAAASEMRTAVIDAVCISACVQMPSLSVLGTAGRMFDVPVVSASLCTARGLWRAATPRASAVHVHTVVAPTRKRDATGCRGEARP